MTRKKRKRLSVHQRIVVACHEGKGLRLTWEDCRALAQDEAIRAAAESDQEDDFYGNMPEECVR